MMKKGTKITVFVASMALTVGSLIAFGGPRHCGNGMRMHGAWMNKDHSGSTCGNWHQGVADSIGTNR